MIEAPAKLFVEVDLSNEHPQAQQWFPVFDYHQTVDPEILDYSNPKNQVGHFQRAIACWHAIQAGLKGDVTLDLGGAGVHMPWVVSTDIIRAGATHPVYGGTYSGVHVACDSSDLGIFGTGTFGCVLALHHIEHLTCKYFFHKDPAILPSEYKRAFQCDGSELLPILRDHWIRILKPGGTLVIITPDENVCDGFGADKSHTHTWRYETFRDVIISGVRDLVETVEFESSTKFSMHWVARKK